MMKKTQSILISNENGGLGNRLKSWVSVMRISAEPLVYWEVNSSMPASFSDLFSNNCEIKTISKDAITHKSWLLSILSEDINLLPYRFSTVCSPVNPLIRGIGKLFWRFSNKDHDRYKYMLFPKTHSKKTVRFDARHIDLEYERIPFYFREVYSELFQKIRFNENIKQQADLLYKNNIDNETIGIQIRTWRDYPYRYNKYYKPSIIRLKRLMDRATNNKFLIVSDSEEVIESLANIYGLDRIVFFPRKTIRSQSWNSIDGIKEDLIDMLILAKTQNIYASYLSTFSEVSWWLGGAKANVTIF